MGISPDRLCVNVQRVVLCYSVFFSFHLALLPNAFILRVSFTVCTVRSCLDISNSTLLAWTLPFLDFVTAWIRMNPWND